MQQLAKSAYFMANDHKQNAAPGREVLRFSCAGSWKELLFPALPACCLLQAIENACRKMDGPPESETERASVGFVLKIRVCRVHGNWLITFRVLSHGGYSFLFFSFFTDHIGKACRTRFRHVSEYLLAFIFLMPL